MQAIVESACLMHDIGNPPFGHFGEEAIKRWFSVHGSRLLGKLLGTQLDLFGPQKIEDYLNDFLHFDGNPQGFRIVTRLHCEIDLFGLNLTDSTLLASIKYPNAGKIEKDAIFRKKLGVFSSEADIYQRICERCFVKPGHRYFLAYLMELADDICYCLSDIADSFEKKITNSRDFVEEFKSIAKENGVEALAILPLKINNFSYDVSIPVARKLIAEAAEHFARNIDRYIAGEAPELSDEIPSGKILKCFKSFARRFIYTDYEAQRIEIAGSKIVESLLDHFGQLLEVSRADFTHFLKHDEMPKNSRLDTEWRIFKQLSKRMLKIYEASCGRNCTDVEEWLARARLIVDYVSGLTDHSARDFYRDFMGINV